GRTPRSGGGPAARRPAHRGPHAALHLPHRSCRRDPRGEPLPAGSPGGHPMTACARPGCGGQLDEDGFCDTCGLAAVAAAPTPVAVGAPSADGPAGTAATAPATRGSAGSTGTGWSAATAPVTGSSRRGSTRSSSRGLLGAGLVEVPRVPYRDPRTAVLDNPEVPEEKRFCS